MTLLLWDLWGHWSRKETYCRCLLMLLLTSDYSKGVFQSSLIIYMFTTHLTSISLVPSLKRQENPPVSVLIYSIQAVCVTTFPFHIVTHAHRPAIWSTTPSCSYSHALPLHGLAYAFITSCIPQHLHSFIHFHVYSSPPDLIPTITHDRQLMLTRLLIHLSILQLVLTHCSSHIYSSLIHLDSFWFSFHLRDS